MIVLDLLSLKSKQVETFKINWTSNRTGILALRVPVNGHMIIEP